MTLLTSSASNEEILLRYGYRISEEIGSGTFAKVKIAYGTKDKHKIAVKIIDLAAVSKLYKDKFMSREMTIWPLMQHRNILKVHRQLKIMDKVYCFMEFAENGDVIEYLHQNSNVPEDLARTWIYQLLQALRYCHKLGIAHRDVKCDNLLIDKDMNLKLTDFGFARYCVDRKTHRRVLSSTFCGSTAYIPPEIWQGFPYNPFRADVWSVGVCLLIMINNDMPFDESNLMRMHKQQISSRWSYKPGVEFSKQGRSFVKRVLDPDAVKRPSPSVLLESPWLRIKKDSRRI